MAIVTTDSKHYSNIAAAIREKTGEATTYKPEEIPTGVGEVFEAGKQAEYDRFWDTYQAKGKRTGYQFAFAGEGWTDEMFLPKYDLVMKGNCGQIFQASRVVNLYESTIGRGLKFTMSDLSYGIAMFAYATKITHIPALSFVGLTTVGNCFEACFALATIDKITIDERFTFTVSTFRNCDRLENLTIEGVIAKNGLNLSWSPLLTHDSLMSIINALQDKTGDTSASWAVTLGADNLAKLTDAEKAIATQRGWTLA